MKQPVIAVIGAGAVGSATAYALMLRNVAAKIMIVDADADKCCGEVQDLKDTLSLSHTSSVCMASLQDAGQADIIIITAGIAQKPGQKRIDILATNHDIIGSVIHSMKPIKSSSIIIMVTNPVDILTRYVQEISGLPRTRVFGSGTLLDSNRLRGLLGEKLSINPASIQAYVLGEHGDNQFVVWSSAQIGGVSLSSFFKQQDQEELAEKAKYKAYDIISRKGCTAFGVASSLVTYVENIVGDLKLVCPLSCFIDDLGVCLSMPVVLGAQGIERILRPALNKQEQEKLVVNATILDKQYKELRSL
jgi:L-lactate dehydrogenase